MGALIAAVVLVLLALGALVGALLVFRKPWRVHARDRFASELAGPDLQRRIEAFVSQRRGWTITASSPGAVTISCSVTPRTWRKEIQVRIHADSSTGTFVDLSSASPQLFDWREGRRALAGVRAASV